MHIDSKMESICDQKQRQVENEIKTVKSLIEKIQKKGMVKESNPKWKLSALFPTVKSGNKELPSKE